MNRDLLSFYNLSALPFGKEIAVQDLAALPTVEKALSSVRLLIDTRGTGILTGESGAGKSCIIRMLDHQLNAGLFKLIYLCHSSVGIGEFYGHLCAALGLETHRYRANMFRSAKERILSLNRSSHIHPVLVLDDAHLLCVEILKEIRLLTNFEIDSYNALTVVLVGQQSLCKTFGLSSLEPLANSITVNTHLATLPKEESFSYVEHRVTQGGGAAGLFTKNALALIHQAAGGIMRNINTIAQGSLYKAYHTKSAQVEVEHVKAVIER
jgi:type II secretory pathway predicted ATPase ExeA